jgi:hypothetical protein
MAAVQSLVGGGLARRSTRHRKERGRRGKREYKRGVKKERKESGRRLKETEKRGR